MSSQEKAKELVDKFTVVGLQQRNEGIACALIMCDEILIAIQDLPIDEVNWDYWQQVKQEIEKL